MRCPLCQGTGKQTLHGAVISMHEFFDDPDFAEAYTSGLYDHPCDHCGGSGKTTRPEWAAWQDEQHERSIGA